MPRNHRAAVRHVQGRPGLRQPSVFYKTTAQRRGRDLAVRAGDAEHVEGLPGLRH